ALLQKSYTVDFLTKKKKVNEGEIPQYYVHGNHEAIIDPDTFDMVQTQMAARTTGKNRVSCVSVFSSKIKCGCCGGWYGPKVWHSNNKYRRTMWQCNHKFEGEKCSTPNLTEEEIREVFLRAANRAIPEKDEILATYRDAVMPLLSTDELEHEKTELESELNVVAELIEDCIRENAHVALDQAEYQQHYDSLVERFDKAKARHTEVSNLITERQARRQQIEMYLEQLQTRDLLTEFRDEDWFSMVDYMTVVAKDDITVKFKDGTEIRA
ncbi:MAG: recombinase family protein, partial [Clostridiales bacterium]|nr:recombinase family protein [Clostridiales bacterium]